MSIGPTDSQKNVEGVRATVKQLPRPAFGIAWTLLSSSNFLFGFLLEI